MCQQDCDNVSLFDILINLFPSAASRIKNNVAELDSPANGMMINYTLRDLFNRFCFCLVPWVSLIDKASG